MPHSGTWIPRNHANSGSAWLLACALKIRVKGSRSQLVVKLVIMVTSGFKRDPATVNEVERKEGKGGL